MPLLKNNAFVTDAFVELAEGTALPQTGHVILSAQQFHVLHDGMSKSHASIGVKLSNTDKIEDLQEHLASIALIVLPFPAFGDGRSYSLGRQLRLDGYRGELRAEGNVLPDQLQFMRQVGFDSFLVGDRFPLEVWQAAAKQMSLAYQRGLYKHMETEVWSSRHQGFKAWEEQPHAG